MFRQVIEKAMSEQGLKMPIGKTDGFLTSSDNDDTWTVKIGDQISLYMEIDANDNSMIHTTSNSPCAFMAAFGIENYNAKCGAIECRSKNQLPSTFKVCNQMNYSAAKAYYKKLEASGVRESRAAAASAAIPDMSSSQQLTSRSSSTSSLLMLRSSRNLMGLGDIHTRKDFIAPDMMFSSNADDTEMQLQTLRLKMEKEREQNRIEAERSNGKEVLYGQGIQLLHLKTNKFLTVARESAEMQKDCMRLTLDENGNANSIFHILPYYSFRTEGQKVLISDQIRLANAGSNQYIHLSKFKYKNDTRSLREINMSTDMNDTRWRLRLYTPFLDYTTFRLLKAGDIIRLYHTDANGYLTVDRDRGHTVKIESEMTGPDSKASSNSMWEVEMLDPSRGGLLEWSSLYRLKHAATSKYMTVRVPVVRDEDDEDDDDDDSSSSLSSLSDRWESDDSGSGKESDDESSAAVMQDVESSTPTSALSIGASSSDEQPTPQSASSSSLLFADDAENEGYLTPRSREKKSLASARMMGSMFDLNRSRSNSVQAQKPSKWQILRKKILKDSSLLETTQSSDRTQRFELFVDESAATSTLFTVHPPDTTRGHVAIDSFIRVKHNQTSSWLHAITRNRVEEESALLKLKRNESKQNLQQPTTTTAATTTTTAISRRSSKYVRIDTRMVMSEEDVFVIKPVPKDEIDDLLFIQATLPVIDSMIYKLKSQFTLKKSEISNVSIAFAQLIIFCTESDIIDPLRREGIPYKNRQNYIREQKVLDKVMEILMLLFEMDYLKPNEIHDEKHFAFKELMKFGYRLIKQSCKLNNQNGLYMSPYISVIQSQIESNIGVSAALAEILSNNYDLLNKITEDEIKFFIHLLLDSKKNSDYLSFLSALCDVDGKPVSKNQDVIAQLLFGDQRDAKEILMIPYVTADDKIVIMIDGREVELNKFAKPDVRQSTRFLTTSTSTASLADNTSANLIADLHFLENTIELLSKLCMGRNAKSITVVSNLLSFNIVLECVQDEALPPKLRSHFCNLLLYCYIDTAPYERKPLIILTRNWTPQNVISAQEKRKQVKKGTEKMKELKGFIDYYFSKNYELDKSKTQIENNRFTLTLTRICKTLFEFGIYKDMEEIDPIINKLFNVLDGKNDKYNMKALQDQERFVQDEQNVVISAIKLEICRLFNIIFDIAQDRRISYFIEAFKHRVENDVLNSASVADIATQERKDNLLVNKLFAYSKKNEKPSTILDSPDFKRKFYGAMQDLMNYENQALANSAMNLLFRAHHQKEELNELLPKIELLVSRQMIRSYNELNKSTSKMRQLLAGDSYSRIRGDEAKRIKELMETMINDVKQNGNRSQRIMRNLQVQDIALTLLNRTTFNDSSTQTLLWRCSTRLLTEFVRNNSDNQQILFRHIEFLISRLGSIPETCTLLCEIVKNNRVLCSTIEEKHVRSFIDAIAENGLSARYLSFLRSIVSMNGKPVKRNQTLVTENLMERRKDVMKLFSDEEGLIERNRRIQQNEHITKPDGILNYHIMLLQLLCDCADGKNHVSEVKLQALLSIEAVLDQLTDSILIPQLRDPLIRFLDEVYVNTEKENPKLQTSSKLWILFERMNKELEYFISNPQVNTRRSINDARSAIIAHYRKSTRLNNPLSLSEEQQRHLDRINQAIAEEENNEEEVIRLHHDDSRESVVLTVEQQNQVDHHYVYKLLIPLIHHYFHKHYPPPLLTEHQENITRQLILNLTELYTKTANPNLRESIRKCVQGMYKKRLNVKGSTQAHIQNFLVKLMADTAKPVQIFRERANRFEEKDEQICNQYVAYIRLLKIKFVEKSDMRHIATLYNEQKDLNTLIRVLRKMVTIGYNEESIFATVCAVRSLQTVMENAIEMSGNGSKSKSNNEDELQVTLRQMVTAEVPSLVLELLCSSVNVIVKEALQLGILLLVDGNQTVQKSVYTIFTHSQSEAFFVAIRDRIRLAIREIKTRSDFSKKQKLKITAIEESTNVINLAELQKRDANHVKQMQEKLKVAQAISTANHTSGGGDGIELEDVTDGGSSGNDKADRFIETGYIDKILRFLQLMCEGHNQELQNYLNAQPDNTVSVNLVQECLHYLLALEKYIDPQTVNIAIQCFDTLIEFIQGPCQNNQQVVGTSPKFYFASNELLQVGTGEEFPLLDILKLRFKIILSMISILEGNGDSNISILMRNSLNIGVLQSLLLKCARAVSGFEDEELHRRSRRDFNQAQQNGDDSVPPPQVLFLKMKKYHEKLGLHIYFLLNIFIDQRASGVVNTTIIQSSDDTSETTDKGSSNSNNNNNGGNLTDELEYWLKENRDNVTTLSVFKNMTGRIEILFKNNLERVYFRKPDISNNMIEETKQDFLYNCDRETAQSKVVALFKETNRFRMEMEHYEDFRIQTKARSKHLDLTRRLKAYGWNFVEKYWDLMRRLSFFYTILLNIVMCVTYKKSFDTLQGPIPIPGFQSNNEVLTGSYSVSPIEYLMFFMGLLQLFFTLCFFFIYLYFYAKLKVKKKFEQRRYRQWEKMETNFNFVRRYIVYSLRDRQMWSYIVMFGISLIGFVVTPLAYCVLLFEVIVRAKTLSNVLTAIKDNYRPLILTAVLMVISMFFFSIMYFTWRQDDFVLNEDLPSETVICNTSLMTCFVGIINYGFRGGGFWEDITPASLGAVRFLLDMGFYTVVVTILISVVFGIILDSFADLREENYETDRLVRDRCFICDIEKSRFDMRANEGITFETHVKQEHYMWNYVFFLIYLFKKKKTEFTGIEQYIADLASQEDTAFFPILRSLTLEESDAVHKIRQQSYDNAYNDDNMN